MRITVPPSSLITATDPSRSALTSRTRTSILGKGSLNTGVALDTSTAKILFDFNAKCSERVSFVRCSNGLVLNCKLYGFGSSKSVDLLKKALGDLIGHESFPPEDDDS